MSLKYEPSSEQMGIEKTLSSDLEQGRTTKEKNGQESADDERKRQESSDAPQWGAIGTGAEEIARGRSAPSESTLWINPM